MQTHRDFIDALGGPHKVASKLRDKGFSVADVTVRAWHMRSSIPSRAWLAFVDISKSSGRAVTLQQLAAKAAGRRAA